MTRKIRQWSWAEYYSTCNSCGCKKVVTTNPYPMCRMCAEQYYECVINPDKP